MKRSKRSHSLQISGNTTGKAHTGTRVPFFLKPVEVPTGRSPVTDHKTISVMRRGIENKVQCKVKTAFVFAVKDEKGVFPYLLPTKRLKCVLKGL